MKNNRDMYISKDNSYNRRKRLKRRRNQNGRNHSTIIYTLIVVFIAVALGFTAFIISKEQLKHQDDTLQVQEKNRKQTDGVLSGKVEQKLPEDSIVDNEVNLESNITDNNTLTSGEGGTETGNAEEGDTEVGQINESITNSLASSEDGLSEETLLSEEDKSSEPLEEEFMPDFVDTRTPIKVKGIYVTGPRAGSAEYMEDLISLVDTTELNAMVIDIKNDSGEITYKMDLETVKDIKADVNYIRDIKQLVKELKAKDIYLIARIVAFKDPILAEGKPKLSIKNSDGSVFRDKDGLSWVNPYKKEVWEYLLAIAEEAVDLGFDEIQFDYIRFSTDSKMKSVDFGEESKDKSKIEVITEFTKYASEQLKPKGVYVSADVYGAIIDSKIDAEIVGQSYLEMSKYLDYICPMIYPSHYADGAYGIEHPDLEPYNLILQALNKSKSVLSEIKDGRNKAEVRSWLQDFTAKWLNNYITYGPEEIRAQIQAIYDAGYEEWILWNGSNSYTKDGLLTE